jgi:hypothetical protein
VSSRNTHNLRRALVTDAAIAYVLAPESHKKEAYRMLESSVRILQVATQVPLDPWQRVDPDQKGKPHANTQR